MVSHSPCTISTSNRKSRRIILKYAFFSHIDPLIYFLYHPHCYIWLHIFTPRIGGTDLSSFYALPRSFSISKAHLFPWIWPYCRHTRDCGDHRASGTVTGDTAANKYDFYDVGGNVFWRWCAEGSVLGPAVEGEPSVVFPPGVLPTRSFVARAAAGCKICRACKDMPTPKEHITVSSCGFSSPLSRIAASHVWIDDVYMTPSFSWRSPRLWPSCTTIPIQRRWSHYTKL